MNLMSNLIPFKLKLAEIAIIIKNIKSFDDFKGLEEYLFSLLGNPFITDTESFCSIIKEKYGVEFKEHFKVPTESTPTEVFYLEQRDIFIIRIIWEEVVRSSLLNKEAFISISLKDLKKIYPEFSNQKIVSKSYEIINVFFHYEGIKAKLDKPYIRRNSLYIRFK